MNPTLAKELKWLLFTLALTLWLLLGLAWYFNWSFMPGGVLDVQLHDTYIQIAYSVMAMYVFAHIAMVVYSARNFWEGFVAPKLNMILVVVYGYVAYTNYMLGNMMGKIFFHGTMVVALLLAAVTIVAGAYRLWQKFRKQ